MEIPTEALVHHTDARGRLLKAWPEAVNGEVYVVELRPGHPRGHHVHARGGEWFIPLSGHAILSVQDPATGEVAHIALEGIRARVAPGLAHALHTPGPGPALVMAVADLRPEDDQTHPHTVPLKPGETPT